MARQTCLVLPAECAIAQISGRWKSTISYSQMAICMSLVIVIEVNTAVFKLASLGVLPMACSHLWHSPCWGVVAQRGATNKYILNVSLDEV